MATYVIVHGAFLGGWRWRSVANMLRATGHEVYTPTLTGFGERAHLTGPQVDLNTHIQDVVGVLECEDLREVILVGHSYGSIVITGVAERVPERLARLVYLDTAIPQDGQSWFDVLGPEVASTSLDLAHKEGDGWLIPLFSDPPRIQPQPIKTVTDSLTIRNPAAAAIPRAFIFCTGKSKDDAMAFVASLFERTAEYARQQGWWYREIPSDHGPEVSMPRELADLLLELA